MAAGLGPQERRKAPRVAERVPLALSDAGAEFQAETQNLSTSGVYCTLDRFVPPMTKLQLRFELPDGARRITVCCSGVVVRIEPVIANAERGRYHVGIFFSDLSQPERTAIERFVCQRLAAAPSTD